MATPHQPEAGQAHPGVTPKPVWYLRGELWLLIAIVLGIHFTRLDSTMLRGEETRRATVAMEMLRTGDWIVPDLQGDVFYFSNRPPLQQWIIAALGTVRGEVDTIAVRLPSAAAVLLTTLLIWWYCGAFLSRLGAFAAAAAFASMGHVIELGSRGESDAMFTLFVSASLLLWHRGYALGWPAWRTWCLAYLCVALGTLTKGVQAPLYFSVSVAAYLLVVRRPGFAFTRAHLAGIGVFLLVWGSWQAAFLAQTSLDAMRYIYFGDVVRYGNERNVSAIAEHMVSYPIKLVFCLLPWSILIASFIGGAIRRATITVRPLLVFAVAATLFTFPSVWLVQGAESRFFLSMYPCFAVMTGIVVQLSIEAPQASGIRTIWRNFAVILALAAMGTGLTIAVASFIDTPIAKIAQPHAFAIVFLLVCIALTILLWRNRHAATLRQGVLGVTCVAAYIGMLYTGVVINVDQRDATNKIQQIAHARDVVPVGEQLFSLGPVDHGFAYYYRDAIAKTPWPSAGQSLPENVEYFVFLPEDELGTPDFDFAWEPIAFVETAATTTEEIPRLLVVAQKRSGTPDARTTSEIVRDSYLRAQSTNTLH